MVIAVSRLEGFKLEKKFRRAFKFGLPLVGIMVFVSVSLIAITLYDPANSELMYYVIVVHSIGFALSVSFMCAIAFVAVTPVIADIQVMKATSKHMNVRGGKFEAIQALGVKLERFLVEVRNQTIIILLSAVAVGCFRIGQRYNSYIFPLQSLGVPVLCAISLYTMRTASKEQGGTTTLAS
jgi:uncharacterized membrane protein